MLTRPVVSVLLTNYNGSHYIRESIDSILVQSLASIELIIIDDGSTDESVEIIKEYQAIDQRVKFIQNPTNLGTSLALNCGLKLSHGIYITRQDSDDISKITRLESQAEFLENNLEYDAVCTPAWLIESDGNPIRVEYTLNSEQIGEKLLESMCICGPTLMVRNSVFEKIGYYFSHDLSYTEDYDLCLRITDNGRIGNLAQPQYLYRQHINSVSSMHRHKQISNKAIALERALDRRYGSRIPSRYVALLGKDYLRAAIIALLSNDRNSADISVNNAKNIVPEILSTEGPLSEVLSYYLPSNNPQAAIESIDRLFDELIKEHPNLANLKKRLLGKYHVEAAFSKLHEKDLEKVEHHIRQGVRNDPFWLGNRGVRSIIMKLILRRIGIPVRLNGNTA